jgi:hypothetical protein
MIKYNLLTLFLLLSCDINKLVISYASPIIDGGIKALFQETDVKLAEDALAGQLKLLEGFLINDPDNINLLTNASMGFTSYALGFVEDFDKERAKNFYLRAKNYGLRALKQNDTFNENINKHYNDFTAALIEFDNDDVPSLFWTAISWGLYIKLDASNPDAISDLSKVESMMTRVKQLNPRYFGGGADMFFGVIECIKPAIAGGDPKKAIKHFQDAIAYSDNDFLLIKAFMAQYYTTRIFDEKLFNELLIEIENAPPAKDPNNNLPNAIAKKKVTFLRKEFEDYF